jgi:hypothetical protein
MLAKNFRPSASSSPQNLSLSDAKTQGVPRPVGPKMRRWRRKSVLAKTNWRPSQRLTELMPAHGCELPSKRA